MTAATKRVTFGINKMIFSQFIIAANSTKHLIAEKLPFKDCAMLSETCAALLKNQDCPCLFAVFHIFLNC